jgi:antirestriction protein ArdC
MSATAPRADVYSRVTNKIIADLERGVRPWLKPWSAEHAAGRITRPLRANGQAYKGIDVLMPDPAWRQETTGNTAQTIKKRRSLARPSLAVRSRDRSSAVMFIGTPAPKRHRLVRARSLA